MIYATHKIAAASVYDVYEEYKEWIDKINQKESAKIVIVSTNLVQNAAWSCMIITYSYE
jgi:hypothetical protein